MNKTILGVCVMAAAGCVFNASAAEVDTPERQGTLVQLTAGALVEAGTMLAVSNGVAFEAADLAGYVVVGRCEATAVAGASVIAKRGVFRWANGATFTAADIGIRCYVDTSDGDRSVTSLAASTNKIPAGYIVDVDGAGVWVDTYNDTPLISTSVASLAITGAATVGTTLGVTGAATVGGTIEVTGASTLTGNTTVGGTLGVTGASTLTNTVVTGTLGVTGASTLTGALIAHGAATLNGAVTITNAVITIANLPTSTNGLTAGRLWVDTGVVSVYTP